MNGCTLTCSAILVAALASASPAGAQEVVPEDLGHDKVLGTTEKEQQRADGWAKKLSVGATGSYNHNSNVVGAVDGGTTQLGLIVDGHAHLKHGQHLWENVLSIKETQTRTPQLDLFIKSADEARFASTWMYRLKAPPWLGPYVRGMATTQLLLGSEVRTEDVNIQRIDVDGQVIADKQVLSGTRYHLTKSFEPTVVKESAGVFANPIDEETLTLKAKAGAGFQHVFVRDGFTIADNKDTVDVIEYQQLQASTQGGAELEAEANGKLTESTTWSARAAFFYPLYTSVDTELEGLDVMSTELGAKVSVRLAKWLSLDYVFSAKRLPLVLDEWQVQNGVLLTAGFDLI